MASIQKTNKSNLPIDVMGHELNPLLTLQHDLSKTMSHFYDLFEPKHFNIEHFENIKLSPCMDLVENKDHFKIEVEMPGLDEKDIKVSICDNLLTIVGEKSLSKKDVKKNFIDREIRYGRYERSISLPQTADWNHVSASFKKGMLWIMIPKISSKKSCSRDVKVCRMDDKK